MGTDSLGSPARICDGYAVLGTCAETLTRRPTRQTDCAVSSQSKRTSSLSRSRPRYPCYRRTGFGYQLSQLHLAGLARTPGTGPGNPLLHRQCSSHMRSILRLQQPRFRDRSVHRTHSLRWKIALPLRKRLPRANYVRVAEITYFSVHIKRSLWKATTAFVLELASAHMVRHEPPSLRQATYPEALT
jgi:hypothetical protein